MKLVQGVWEDKMYYVKVPASDAWVDKCENSGRTTVQLSQDKNDLIAAEENEQYI